MTSPSRDALLCRPVPVPRCLEVLHFHRMFRLLSRILGNILPPNTEGAGAPQPPTGGMASLRHGKVWSPEANGGVRQDVVRVMSRPSSTAWPAPCSRPPTPACQDGLAQCSCSTDTGRGSMGQAVYSAAFDRPVLLLRPGRDTSTRGSCRSGHIGEESFEPGSCIGHILAPRSGSKRTPVGPSPIRRTLWARPALGITRQRCMIHAAHQTPTRAARDYIAHTILPVSPQECLERT